MSQSLSSSFLGRAALLAAVVAAGAAMTGSAGATGWFSSSYSGETISRVPAQAHRIGFSRQAFAQPISRQVTFADSWEREDYALFQEGGAQAEIVHIAAANTPIALDYYFTSKEQLETWNFNRGRPKVFGVTDNVRTYYAKVFYTPYRLTDEGRSCVAFSGAWDYLTDDPEHRPGQAIFGYFCERPGGALTQERIRDIIRRLDIPNDSVPVEVSRLGAAPSAAEHAQALAEARGQGGSGRTGNPSFPFKLARSYNDFDGSDRR